MGTAHAGLHPRWVARAWMPAGAADLLEISAGRNSRRLATDNPSAVRGV
jgi:hypothetical protein